MKCPHCGRFWDTEEFAQDGLSPTVVLVEHVQRFCAGHPDPHAIVHGRPAQPAARSALVRR